MNLDKLTHTFNHAFGELGLADSSSDNVPGINIYEYIRN